MVDDHRDIARGITARHLQVPIEDALAFHPDDQSVDALKELEANNFDYAPVTIDGRIIGVVSRTILKSPAGSTVGEATRPIGTDLIISADATVADLLGWLADEPLLFVLDGHDVTGFVNRATSTSNPVTPISSSSWQSSKST